VLSNVEAIFTAVNFKVEIAGYNINQGLSLIEELNNYVAVVFHSLNRALALIPFIKVPTLIDVHSPDWLWYFREEKLGIKPRPETRPVTILGRVPNRETLSGA
jgi:hypothetical protein